VSINQLPIGNDRGGQSIIELLEQLILKVVPKFIQPLMIQMTTKQSLRLNVTNTFLSKPSDMPSLHFIVINFST